MLRFFRSIRQGLLKQNKLGRYLIYALGEVVLVIIGILIALSLNNFNEAKTQDKKIEVILVQIQNELLTIIEDSSVVIEAYRHKDSLIYLIMNRKVNVEDFKKPSNRDFRFISTNFKKLEMQDDGFKNLILKSEVISEKYLPLVNELKQLYFNDKKVLDELNEFLVKVVSTTLDYQRDNYDWYADYYFLEENLTDEVLDYFINSNKYRNSLADFSNIAMYNLLPTIFKIRIDAIKYIRAIDVLLEKVNTYDFDVNGKNYAHWNGKYHYQGDTVQFANDEEGVKWFNEGEWVEVYPLGNDTFHSSYPAFWSFEKDESGQISGLRFQVSNTNLLYEKIK
jgi:hypothetical protein